ncbi:MAG: putative toxin-antitoxin system toxin component, PIN family [Trueperaceae bacterium]
MSGTVTSSVDARILIEYGQVLARPKVGFDPDDEPFFQVAIAGRADALVTGNLVHVPASARAGVTVLRPTEFFAWVRDA